MGWLSFALAVTYEVTLQVAAPNFAACFCIHILLCIIMMAYTVLIIIIHDDGIIMSRDE